MAFGIDDALLLATASISLADTIVKTVQGYETESRSFDLEQLIQEVKHTVLMRIDEADKALNKFEMLLKDSGVDLSDSLDNAIAKTPFWRPFQQYKLKEVRNSFRSFSDSIYDATDDVAALVRCQDNTKAMGVSVVDSIAAKRKLQSDIINSTSIGSAIARLRDELDNQKKILTK